MKRLISMVLVMAMLMAMGSIMSLITFAESAEAGETYVLTSMKDIKTGDQVVIVSADTGLAVAVPSGRGYSGAEEVKIEDNQIIAPAEDLIWDLDVISGTNYNKYCTLSQNGQKLSMGTPEEYLNKRVLPGDEPSMEREYDYLLMGGSYDVWSISSTEESAISCSISNKTNNGSVMIFDSNWEWMWGTEPPVYAVGVSVDTYGPMYTDFHFYVKDSGNQEEPEEPVVPSYRGLRHTLNLESDISVNYWVEKALVEELEIIPTTLNIAFKIETYEDGVKTAKNITVFDAKEYGDYYYFTLSGLTAVNMNDTITACLYGTMDALDYFEVIICQDEYSIANYAYSQLNKGKSSPELKTLCADILRYGAKAQIYKNYRTDVLADGAMTEAHKNYLSNMDAVIFGNTDVVLDDLENAPIVWAGESLNLESKVTLKYIFDPTGYTGDLSELTMQASYKGIKGEDKTITVTDPKVYNEEKNLYAFTFDTLLAAELRTAVSVQIFDGETPVSATLQYSADTYGNGKDAALLELCKALFSYSDSAKAYFVIK